MPSHIPRKSFDKKNMERKVEQKPPRIKVVNIMSDMDMAILKKHSRMLVSPSSEPASRSPTEKVNCLCSPTTHAGSFRCRHHRTTGLRRGKSIGSNLAELGSKVGPISDTLHAQ